MWPRIQRRFLHAKRLKVKEVQFLGGWRKQYNVGESSGNFVNPTLPTQASLLSLLITPKKLSFGRYTHYKWISFRLCLVRVCLKPELEPGFWSVFGKQNLSKQWTGPNLTNCTTKQTQQTDKENNLKNWKNSLFLNVLKGSGRIILSYS